MTDEIGITITAANSGAERGRIERLLDVLAIVHSLLDRNVIDMADEDTEEGTYSAFVKALASIRDDRPRCAYSHGGLRLPSAASIACPRATP